MLESAFQRKLRNELKAKFPGAIIMKLDALEIQGVPDLLILYKEKWATLECKRKKDASHQPNQDYYVHKMNEMSFSSFIYPENKELVLHELYDYFEGRYCMSSKIIWHDNSRRFQKDSHALFGASKYAWINYDENKMIETYNNSKAKKIGTELHELAAMLIRQKTPLPDEAYTLNMYVNDAIRLSLRPEEQLYYSQLFYGTADAIGIVDGVLHVHDLKTGKIEASMHQLEIYAAYFFLEYDLLPSEMEIELRIYQNDDMKVSHPDSSVIVPIMDKIVTVDKIISKMEEAKWESVL